MSQRTTTAIRFPAALHAELAKAAEDRDVSINWLVNRAVADFLPRLIPADQLCLTRQVVPVPHQPVVADSNVIPVIFRPHSGPLSPGLDELLALADRADIDPRASVTHPDHNTYLQEQSDIGDAYMESLEQ